MSQPVIDNGSQCVTLPANPLHGAMAASCHPVRDAARSDALQTRDRVREEAHSSRDPVIAVEHCMPRRAQDDLMPATPP
jgi:CRISPR/Cas system-associated exonuclease Cas4 (RecB family)